MSSNIILGLKVTSGPLKRHKLENYNLQDIVAVLKQEAAKATGLDAANIEVIYHGKILMDNTTLLEHGVKNGEMIHILKKPGLQQIAAPASDSEMTIEQLISAIRIFGPVLNSSAWAQALQIVNDPVLMEEILAAVPELKNDPVSLSILCEPELVAHLRNNPLARKLNTEKPALIAGVKKLVQIVNRRLSSSRTNNLQNTAASGYAYSSEVLSDDEDEDFEELDDYMRTMVSNINSGITNQQLAAALRYATRTTTPRPDGTRTRGNSDLLQFLQHLPTNSNTTSSEGTSRSQSGNASSRSVITTDMFNNALMQAISTIMTPNNANTNPNSNASGSPTPNPANPVNAQPADIPMSVDPPINNDGSYDTQLQTMREMGLTNERLNIRALLLSDGDVMAAVSLVFSGAIED